MFFRLRPTQKSKPRERACFFDRRSAGGDARSIAWLIIGVAFALRALTINHESLWRDEIDSARFALEPLPVLLAGFARQQWNGAFYLLALRGWMALSGDSPFALRYFSVAFAVLQVALGYAIGRRTLGSEAGLAAAWLMAIAPALIWYAVEGKMYTLQPTLILLAVYALLRAERRRDWLAFVAFTSLSFYTHLLSPLFLAVAAALMLMHATLRAQWRRALGALVALTLPYAPLATWQLPLALRGGESGHPGVTLSGAAYLLLSYWTTGLSATRALPTGWMGQALLFGAIAVPTSIISLGLASMMHSRGMRQHWATLAGFIAWMVLPFALLYAISTRYPLFNPRYLLWTAPAFYLLLSSTIVLGWRNRALRGSLLALLSAMSLFGVWAQLIYPIRPNIREAAACVLRHLHATDPIIFQIPYGQHGLAYYARQAGEHLAPAQIIEAPFTNHGLSAAEVWGQLEVRLSGARRFWLYETEPSMWDARGLVRQWADRHARLTLRCDFRGVAVGLYQR
ncbi:MAG: glycosyltransferase family 39 protein [Thermoflexales bacterium]